MNLSVLPDWRQRAKPGVPLSVARSLHEPGPPPTTTLSVRSEAVSSSANYFEATRQSPDRSSIPAGTFAYHRLLNGRNITETSQRETLAALARYAADNFAQAWSALDLIANYSCPVIPRAASSSPEWNDAANAIFDEWAMVADFTGRFDFTDMQRLASFAVDVDGDCGFLPLGTDAGPRLLLVPAWRIGGGLLSGLSEAERDGVMTDGNGRVTGYRLLKSRNTFENVDAATFFHCYEPDNMDRYRGLSALRRGLNDMRDARDINAFTKLTEKISAAMPAVIEGGALSAQDWPDLSAEDGQPLPTSSDMPKSVTLTQLLGGEIPVISGSLKTIAGATPSGGKIEFMDTLVGFFVAGLGIPPAFFLDTKLTGPNTRMAIGKAQRRFDNRKRLLAKLARWAWLRVIAAAIDDGLLASNALWSRVRFQMPTLATIDLGDTATNDREAVVRGLKSRASFHGDAGKDWTDEVDQVFAEDKFIFGKASALAKETGVPIETILTRHGYVPPQPKPESKPGAAGGSGGASSVDAGLTPFDLDVLDYNPNHDRAGRFATAAERAARAMASRKHCGKSVQDRADRVEAAVAKMIAGNRTGDNGAFDVIHKHANIEIKAVSTNNSNAKLTVDGPKYFDAVGAMTRKITFTKASRGKACCMLGVAHNNSDDPKDWQFFIKAGVGSYRLSAMDKVKPGGLEKWLNDNAGALADAGKQLAKRRPVCFAGMTWTEAIDYNASVRKFKKAADQKRYAAKIVKAQFKRGRCTRDGKPLVDVQGKPL